MYRDVEIAQGVLRGTQHSEYQSFLGIPYAAPPTGALRFAPPQPALAFDGIRSALEFGPIAPQPRRDAMPVPGTPDEDCLSLNVFTPAADSGRRPVMFFIHGGGFIVGASTQETYAGGPLAARGDVVVVTINYRMGALGYLHLEGATNLGLRDQVAALRWVRDNIAAFGGDPSQVTIFGESAGSVSVCALLAAPSARGLFARAIAQSGTANRLGNRDTAAGTAHAVSQRLGVPADRESLRAQPLAALLRVQDEVAAERGMWAPIVDGDVLPQRPLSAAREGATAQIPLLIGTNRDESKLYIDPKRAQIDDETLERHARGLLPHKARAEAARVIDTYRASRREHGLPDTNNDILDALNTASMFSIPTSRLADAHSAHQADTYVYRFDWESPAARGALGACHGLELPFVFGTLEVGNNPKFAGAGPDAQQLSAQMMDAWLAFAKTGNPSCPALGDWPRYDARERKTLIFARDTHVEAAPLDAEREVWAALL